MKVSRKRTVDLNAKKSRSSCSSAQCVYICILAVLSTWAYFLTSSNTFQSQKYQEFQSSIEKKDSVRIDSSIEDNLSFKSQIHEKDNFNLKTKKESKASVAVSSNSNTITVTKYVIVIFQIILPLFSYFLLYSLANAVLLTL